MELADLVRIYPAVLSHATCRSLIEGFEHRNHLQHRIDDDDCRVTKLNLSHDWPEAQLDILDALIPQFEAYSSDLAIGPHQWPDDLTLENIWISRYNPHVDECPEHVDVVDHGTARRFLSILIWLNDVRDGGETDFPLWRQALRPSAGSLLLFPPMWPWLHAGRTPRSGPKYVLTTFLHYC